jgi:hypothetical protein
MQDLKPKVHCTYKNHNILIDDALYPWGRGTYKVYVQGEWVYVNNIKEARDAINGKF